jgi:hypothetical protein
MALGYRIFGASRTSIEHSEIDTGVIGSQVICPVRAFFLIDFSLAWFLAPLVIWWYFEAQDVLKVHATLWWY